MLNDSVPTKKLSHAAWYLPLTRVWHTALWATMRKYNISANLAALWQGYKCSQGEWQHGRMVQNNNWSKIKISSITHPLQHSSRMDHTWCSGRHDGKVSIGGWNNTNLRFADDIDAVAEKEQELEALVEGIYKTCTRYLMEISAERPNCWQTAPMASRRRTRWKSKSLEPLQASSTSEKLFQMMAQN